MRCNKQWIALLALGVAVVAPNQAAAYPQLGHVYEIEEPDGLSQLLANAAKLPKPMRWGGKTLQEKVRDYRPANLVHLPRAREDRDRLVPGEYTLPFDLPDGNGGVLYPRGFRWNYLERLSMQSVFVVIDGDDPDQVEWLEKIPWLENPRAKVLLSGGSSIELGKKLSRHLFYLTRPLAERANLEAVPCVVSQEGASFRVREFRPDRKQESAHATK